MRKLVFAVAVLVAVSWAGACAGQDVPGHTDLAPSGHGSARGVVNFFTGWLEIPRVISVDCGKYHFTYGWLIGVVEGTFVAVGRTVTGAVDAFTLGFAGDAVHGTGAMPDYVWDAPWTYSATYEEREE
jgi:putative exosortase-associated protein (TIGR04073 family)